MHLLKHRSMVFYLGFILILMMAIGGAAMGAFADGGGETATLGPGTLSEASTFAQNPTATLNGTDQKVPYVLPIVLTDARGSGAAWYLQISGTPLKDGSNHTLTQHVSAASITCVGNNGDTCSVPTSPLLTPLDITTGLQDFFSMGSAMGIYNVPTTVQIIVPGNAFAGTYSTTITLASSATP
jgi:hypothetical protein